MVIPLAGLLWERQFDKVLWSTVEQRFLVGNAKSCTDKKGCFLTLYVDYIKLDGKKQNFGPLIGCGMYSTKKSIWENHHSLIMSTREALKDNVKHAKILLTFSEPCSNPEFPQEQWKNYHAPKLRTFLQCPTILKVIPRSVWNDVERNN